ncbi:unnamed protein product [Effrenium voratum]|nr:unnamed protein product [Effrenium voratum]
MAGLLRRAARCQAALPMRAAAQGPIKPIGPNFPLASEKAMGRHGWMRGSYYFWSLSNPIKGPKHNTPWVVGGIHNPTIDPVKHFNMQDQGQHGGVCQVLRIQLPWSARVDPDGCGSRHRCVHLADSGAEA